MLLLLQEDHDGFYIKCAECGDNFRSKKLQTDHALNQCKSRWTTDVPDLLVKQEFISLDLPMHVDRFDDCSGSNEGSPKNPEEEPEGDNMEVEEKTMVELPSKAIADTKCPHCEKELHRAAALAVHVKDCHTPTKCDQCDLVFEGRSRMSYHKVKLVLYCLRSMLRVFPKPFPTVQNSPDTKVRLPTLSENIPLEEYLSAASASPPQSGQLSV